MRIVLIGDSIRMGYMHKVRELIGSRADVLWPQENCSNSMMIRENLHKWVLALRPDVVHFNSGIHDLGWMPDETVPRFTVSAYVRNLRIIVERLRHRTKARVIFATTTPFLIPLGKTPKERCKPAPIVEKYNKAAVNLMNEQKVDINDLYKVVMDTGIITCLSNDKLHMGETGNMVLARAVRNKVLEQIQ